MGWKEKADEKRKLEKLYNEGRYRRFVGGVYRNDKRGGVLTKAYPYSTNHKNNKKWWRRHANRKTRRDETDILGRGQHKKVFDLWWTLF